MNNLEKYGVRERFINEATMYPDLTLARVTIQSRGSYNIVTEEKELRASLSGKFKYKHTNLDEYPTVGDFVMVSYEEDYDRAIIEEVLTRKSAFKRTAVGVKGQTQIIAANIDIIFICMSLNNNFNLSRLERYLAIAYDSGAVPVIVLTKADLSDDIDGAKAEIEKVAVFTDIVTTSAFDEDLSEIRKYLKGGLTASFVGSSGVGKSTLVNVLLGKEVNATAEIGRYDKGRHTTTRRGMIVLEEGAILIDTPGMRELGAESVDLSSSFSDIEELASSCKFSDCTHTVEPSCAVRKAIEKGELDERRLNSYLKLKKEGKYESLTSKGIEDEKLGTMFKDVGGMKGVKKYLKNTNKRKY